jgi:hypothetical protein
VCVRVTDEIYIYNNLNTLREKYEHVVVKENKFNTASNY